MRNVVALRLAAIPAFVLATSGAAHAALPEGVTTAITAAGADLTTAATAIIDAFEDEAFATTSFTAFLDVVLAWVDGR